MSKCGYIAIIGRPNVGKSTLLNQLLGYKLSITSRKPQTTRHQLLGIKNSGDNQLIFIDTPGIHADQKHAINRLMNKAATAILRDVNIILWMVEATHWAEMDTLILEKLTHVTCPVILLLNKVDLLDKKEELFLAIELIKEKFLFAQIIPMSAKQPGHVEDLIKILIPYLPEGAPVYPENQTTNRSESFLMAELIREKLIRYTGQELPYTTAVVIERVDKTEKIMKVAAVIWVERPGQKKIIIGKNGEKIKKIGTEARKDIEKLIDQKIFLDLWVKIKEEWRDDDNMLRDLSF